jgi:hypothetical protein
MNTATPTRTAHGIHNRNCSHVNNTARQWCPAQLTAIPARPTATR